MLSWKLTAQRRRIWRWTHDLWAFHSEDAPQKADQIESGSHLSHHFFVNGSCINSISIGNEKQYQASGAWSLQFSASGRVIHYNCHFGKRSGSDSCKTKGYSRNTQSAFNYFYKPISILSHFPLIFFSAWTKSNKRSMQDGETFPCKGCLWYLLDEWYYKNGGLRGDLKG